MTPPHVFSLDRFRQVPVVGILRGIAPPHLAPLLEATRRGGLTNLEITMNSPDALVQIREAIAAAGSDMNIGAGTVTSLELLDQALEAGAGFIVTPTLVPPVIGRCVALGVPVFPGAFTPTEIQRAHDLGAAMVKVFPADVLGPGYLRSLKAPMPHLRLMPTGGVDLDTLQAFRQAGADAFGVGSPLFRRDKVEAGDWSWIESRCAAFKQLATSR